MSKEATTILLQTEDFNEVAGLEKLLRANGIVCKVERVKPSEGARTPTKRVTVSTPNLERASKLLLQLQDRRHRLRRIGGKPRTTSDGVADYGLGITGADVSDAIDSIIDTIGTD